MAITVFARGGRDREPMIAQISGIVYDRFADAVRNVVALFLRLR